MCTYAILSLNYYFAVHTTTFISLLTVGGSLMIQNEVSGNKSPRKWKKKKKPLRVCCKLQRQHWRRDFADVPGCSCPERPATAAASGYTPPCWGSSWGLWAPASAAASPPPPLPPADLCWPPSTCRGERLILLPGLDGTPWLEIGTLMEMIKVSPVVHLQLFTFV